ncbi:MAG: invasin domain 3-containing protein, partial [Balneolales bacterium]
DTVYLTSNSNFELGEGETPTFDDGILTNLNVILTTSGETNIQVENSELNRTGQSNQFYVWPTIVNVDESSVESIPQQITADGNSSSELIVILKDSYGNMLDTGGENVFIHTNKGTLGNDETTTQAEDLGNGLYSAILTSSTITETATVEAYIDEVKIDEVQVEFVAGLLAAFNIEVPVENDEPVTQMAGVPFQIVIQAMDENNNIISDFNSNLVFSTNSSFLAGETVHMDSGNFVHSVSLSKADSNVTLSVTQDNINDVQGISELFGVIANIPAQSNSMVNASEVILQNDGSSQALITIILRDLYNNHINQEYSVTIEPEQLEEDGLPSSGSPNASISSVTFNQELGEYQSTLTASNITELIAFNAFFEGGPSDLSKTLIDEVININIVYPNQWQSGGGPPANRVDWLNEDNWSLGRIPTDLDFVIIPGGLTDYPNLDVNIILGSLTIEDGGILTLFGGNSISITSTLTVNGLLDIKDNTILNIGSSFIGSGTFTGGESVSVIINGNLTVNSFLARTAESVVRLQGNQPRSISTANFLAERLEIRNELLATSNLIDLSVLDISSGNSFELDTNGDKVLDVSANVIGEGNLILNDNQLTLRGNYNLSNIDASDAKIVFEGTTEQEIINLSLMKNAEINNPENVRFFDDVIIDGNLNLIRGIMVINSGKSLIAQNQIYEGGALLFRRSISNVRGWRMMTAPLATSFSDFFDGLTLQGIPGTSFEDRQPNLLYYDETVTGTDNQRWRAPGSAGNQLQSGRGYFFYVFGNPDDEDYNDILPKTLTVNGQDNIAGGSEFEFMVTYTSEADTGWNLLGNPFGAAINWNSLGWTKNNIDETMYVWDSDANNGDGEYRVFNGITGSHDGIIPPFQAFWVKANQVDPEMIFNKSSLSTGGVFYKKGTRSKVAEITDNSSPLVTFQLDKDEMKNSTYFMFSDSARAGKDKYDGYKLKSMGDTYLEIYSHLENGSQLSINNLPKKSILPFQIPIGVGGYINGNAINGEFALSWPLISKVPETWLLELIDNETNTIIDMTDQEVYNFTISGDQPKIAAHKYGQPDMQIMKSITGGNRFTFKITPDKPNESDIPAKFSLEQNYPNPFNPSTTILFALPEASFVKLVIYDILGRQVSVLASRDYEAGYHEVIWDASRFASGLYIYRIQAGKNIKTKKMTVIN